MLLSQRRDMLMALRSEKLPMGSLKVLEWTAHLCKKHKQNILGPDPLASCRARPPAKQQGLILQAVLKGGELGEGGQGT